MPSIAFQSRLRTATEQCALTMTIQHRLVIGDPSNDVRRVKSPPENLLVSLASQALVTISGSINNTRVAPNDIFHSHIARHFVAYLRLNADDLAITAVSDAYISTDTGILTLSFTSCMPPFMDCEAFPPHAILSGFDICYSWQIGDKKCPTEFLDCPMAGNWMNPFSSHLPLTYMSIVNNAVDRFATFHVVKRYPLIFGAWQRQRATEMVFYSAIYASIRNIIRRSFNPESHAIYEKLLKLCRRRAEINARNTINAISDWLGEVYNYPRRFYNDNEIFSACMDEFFRYGMKRPLFKGKSSFCDTQDSEYFDNNLRPISEVDIVVAGDDESVFSVLDELEEHSSPPLDQHHSYDLDCYSDREFSLESCLSTPSSTLVSSPCSKVSDIGLSGLATDDFELDICELSDNSSPSLKFIARPRIDMTQTDDIFKDLTYEDAYEFREASLNYGWSADIDLSHGKADNLFVGGLLRDNLDIVKVDLGSSRDDPTTKSPVAPVSSKFIVEEVPISHSGNGIFFEFGVIDDHGIMDFEDEIE